jgi:iron transport multicopper oxidase
MGVYTIIPTVKSILTMQVFLLIVACIFVESSDVYFNITVKTVIFNPDGYPLPVIKVYEAEKSTERPFPGPLIRATIGDTLHVNIQNDLNERTSLHFHGIHMQNNVWMDGAMDITECGIAPGSNFTYSFQLTQTGTYWYHSHSGVQYGDGLFGPLVIDYQKGEDPVFRDFVYQTEHIVVLQDWLHEVGNDVMLLYSGPYGAYSGFRPKYPWPPQSFLIGGIGQANCTWDDCSSIEINDSDPCEEIPQCFPIRPPYFGKCNNSAHSPIEFACPAGEYVRMRIINAASNLPSRFWIDRHNMTIVARDGVETEHLVVGHITIPVAQRIDVILLCDQDPGYNYLVFSAIPAAFIPKGANFPNIWTYAFLTYSNSTQTMEPFVTPDDRYMNRNDSLLFEYGLKPRQPTIAPAATKRILLLQKVAWNTSSGPLEQWAINNITFLMSTQPFLPAIYGGANLIDIIASKDGVAGNKLKTHIEKVKYGETVEVVLVSNDLQQHPWHLHGQWVNFVGAGFFTTNPSIDSCGFSSYSDFDAVANVESLLVPYNQVTNVTAIGDSFTVPGFGYVAFRFTATNPGPWFFHCHVEWHLGLGMALILSVENDDGTYPNIGPIPSHIMSQCSPYTKYVTQNIKNPIFMYLFFGVLIVLKVFIFAVILLVVLLRKARRQNTKIPRKSYQTFNQ